MHATHRWHSPLPHLVRVSSRRCSASSSFPALTRQKTSTWVSLSRDARMCTPRKPVAPVRRTRWGGREDLEARKREYLSHARIRSFQTQSSAWKKKRVKLVAEFFRSEKQEEPYQSKRRENTSLERQERVQKESVLYRMKKKQCV